MAVTIRIPAPSSMLVINLLGLCGLVGLSLAIGGLTHNWWWSLLAGSVSAVALAVIATTHAAAEEAKQAGPASAPTPLQRSA